MKDTYFLSSALAAFVVAVSGSDIFAHVTIAHETPVAAVAEHIEWIRGVGCVILMLLAPFAVVALLGIITKRYANTRSAVGAYFSATSMLVCLYFLAFQAAEHATLERKWTAATLSIALLPFLAGIPVTVLTTIAALVVARFDRRVATGSSSRPGHVSRPYRKHSRFTGTADRSPD